MGTYDVLREARQKALDARGQMLDVRPEEAIPPLPDSIFPDPARCLHYFETATHLYFKAAAAYSAGDFMTGHTYELWAYQYLMLAQTCEEQTA